MSSYVITKDGELYHYGVLGMRWEKRKKKETKNNSDNQQKKLDSTDKYISDTKTNRAIRRVGYGAKVTSAVMNHIGKRMYMTYRNDSTPGKTAIINGMGYGSRALNKIGDVAITGSFLKQHRDYREWRKS